MTNLHDYLKQNDSSVSLLARRVGCSASTISRALSGKRNPNFDLALAVEDATHGQLVAEDFMVICMKARRAFLLQDFYKFPLHRNGEVSE